MKIVAKRRVSCKVIKKYINVFIKVAVFVGGEAKAIQRRCLVPLAIILTLAKCPIFRLTSCIIHPKLFGFDFFLRYLQNIGGVSAICIKPLHTNQSFTYHDMKFLFTIQGEGRGHLTQALTLKRHLEARGHEIVMMIVGKSAVRQLPKFFTEQAGVRVHTVESPNFLPAGKRNRPPLTRSIVYNFAHALRFRRSVNHIKRMAKKVDVVVNFYELLTGLAYKLHRIKTPLVCIGHQYLFLHPDFKFPEGHASQVKLLRFYTRATAWHAKRLLALSFNDMPTPEANRIRVVPPLLRERVLTASPERGDYLFGYMLNAGFSRDIEAWHAEHPDVNIHFFWDRETEGGELKVDDRLTFHSLNDEAFIRYMAGARAYATTAGFESVCEAMYLGKPVLMVPTHIEQLCNACDAERAGAGVCADHFDLDRLNDLQPVDATAYRAWVNSAAERIVGEIEAVAKANGRA